MNKVKVVKNCTISVPGLPKKSFAKNLLVGPTSRYYYPLLWTGNAIDSGQPSSTPGAELYPIPVVMQHTSPQIPDGSMLVYNASKKVYNPVSVGTGTWFSGHGAPGASTGVAGSWYVDLDTGDIYKKNDAITWAVVSSMVPNDGTIAGYVSDTTSETHSAILAMIAGGSGSLIGKLSYEYYPEDYGAIGDGVTDDGDALRNCLTAMDTAGGGVLRLTKTYGWTGNLQINNYVSIWGLDSNGGNKGTLKALDTTSRITWGSFATGKTNTGGGGNFTIDGNNTGNPAALVWMECVRSSFSRITIQKSGGKGLFINGAQNNYFFGVDVLLCNDDAMTLSHGAGGNIFARCELHGTPNRALRLTESDQGVYPYAPTHNVFKHCIMETAANGLSLVDVEAGSLAIFEDCGISQNVGTVSMSSGYLFRILNNPAYPTISNQVVLQNPFFFGGPVPSGTGTQANAIFIQGSHTLTVTGRGFFQNTPNVYSFDSLPTISMQATADFFGVTNVYNPIGTGAAVNFIGANYGTPVGVKVRPNIQSAFRAARSTDNGWRMWINSDGTIVWGDGTSYVPNGPGLGYDATVGCVFTTGGLKTTGRIIRSNASYAINSAGQTITCDTKAYSFHAISAFYPGVIALTNPTDGAEVTLAVTQDNVGGHAITWPSGVVWSGGSPPTDTTAGRMTVVHLRYFGGASQWYEMHRSYGASGAPVTSVNGHTGTVTLGASDVGAEPAIAAGTTTQYFRGDKTWVTHDKASVGLSNVDNTSDLAKPISTAAQAALDAKAAIAQISEWTTPQTNTPYNIPVGAKVLEIEVVASGGGGGSGMRGAAGTVRCGGGGGASGTRAFLRIAVSELSVSTLYVNVGAGGNGGAAQTTDSTAGNAGANGAASYVTTTTAFVATSSLCVAAAGNGGAGGSASAGAGGVAQTAYMFPGGNGGSASATGGAGGGGGISTSSSGGGGAGGGISSADVAAAGGAGGYCGSVFPAPSTAGTAGGGAGVNSPVTPAVTPGQGGSGGGGNTGGAGGKGGDGARGAGGGGGGAALNGNPSGAGGKGGDGYVKITAWF